MRVIFLLLLSSIAFQSNSQTWNNYLQKRFKSYGIWADSILLVPNDTSLNKTGFAIKGSTAYIGDGVKWTAITGGSSVVDSLVYATKANVIKVRDSLLAADNFWSGVNTFLNTLNVSNDLQLGAANASYGNAIFYNANNSNKVQIFSSDTLATDVDIELPTSSGKLALTTDIAIVDTSIISTKAYVNYKDDIQQGYIDMRKLESDSIAWTGYATRARLQQQMDSASAAQAVINGVQDDSLLIHNTRILANTNAGNTNAANINLKVNIADTASMLAGYKVATILTSGTLADARLSSNVALLNTAQTFTANKTNTALFTSNANGLGVTQDETKGIVLSNTTAATIGVPVQMPPALYFLGSNYCTSTPGPGFNGLGSNYADWKIQVEPVSSDAANMGSKMTFSSRYGNSLTWNKKMEINKDGLIANIGGINTLTIGTGDGVNNGTLIIKARNTFTTTITNNNGNFTISGASLFGVSASTVSFNGEYGNGTKIFSSGVFVSPKSGADAPGSVNSSLVVRDNAYIGSNSAAPTSGLGVVGETKLTGLNTAITTKTANYTALTTDHTILVDATSNNVTITLPTAVGNSRLYTIKRIDGSVNTVTIATTSSQTIDGSTTYTGLLTQYQTVAVQSNGSHYFITSKF